MSLSLTILILLGIGFVLNYGYILTLVKTKNDIYKLSNIFPFEKILDDNVTIQCAEGYTRLIHLEGLNCSSLNNDDIKKSIKLRAEFLKNLQELNITIRSFTLRKTLQLKSEEFNLKTFIGNYADKWFKSLESSFFNNHYLLINAVKKEQLDKACSYIEGGLAEYNPRLVELDNNSSNSPLLSKIHEFLSGEEKLVCPTQKIKEALASYSVELTSDNFIKIENNFSENYRAIATVKSWGDTTDIEIIKALSSMPFNLLISVRLKPLSKFISLQQQQYNLSQLNKLKNNSAINEEFIESINLIEKGDISLFRTEISLILSDKNKDNILKHFAKIEKILNAYSVGIIREKLMCQRAYWSNLLPEFDDIWSREYLLSNENLSELVPWQRDEVGFKKCDWGEKPVCYFPVRGTKNPYGFIFHEDESKLAPAHIGIFGMTGKGKTVLVEHLITCAMNNYPDLFVYAFDRDNGLRVLSEFLPNSKYLNADSKGFNFNPFDCEDTSENKAFLELFIVNVLAKCKDDNDSIKKVSEAITGVFSTLKKQENKNLNSFLELLSPCKAGDNLKKYIESERFKQVFSNNKDLFNGINSRALFFPMDSITADSDLASPMMFYILNKLPKQAIKEASPFFIVVDEAASLLTNADMAYAVERWIQTQRKNRGAVALLFQEVDIVCQEYISKTIVNNLSSFIIFPGSAKSQEACNMLGLNENEAKFALGEIPARHGERAVLLKRKTGTSIYLDINLLPVGNLLEVFKGGSPYMARLKKAKNNLGDNYSENQLLEEYLRIGE